MRKQGLPIVVLSIARRQLRDIIRFVRKQSPQNAEMLRREVLTGISELNNFPKKFHTNKWLKNEVIEYRSVTIKGILIVYRIETTEIVVVEILHGKSNPENFPTQE